MQLEKLIIEDNEQNIIREVQFKSGVNLIVGIPDNDGRTNNIGKTTLIRCIDYCLDGKLKQLYTDKEFPELIHKDVYKFLSTREPQFSLFISNTKNKIVKITRKVICKNTKKKGEYLSSELFIDNEQRTGEEFTNDLKTILFNSSNKKPTLRQLIPRFIRKEDSQLNNVLKYLHPTTTKTDYEKINLFLLNFSDREVIDKKSMLEQKLNILTNEKDTLSRNFNAKDLIQILEVIKRDIAESEQNRDEFKINEKYEKEEEQLKDLQLNIISLEKKISNAKLSVSIYKKQLDDLNSNKSDVNVKQLEAVYQEASFYIDKLSHSFEESIEFYNSMLNNEKEYIVDELDKQSKNIELLIERREKVTTKYSKVLENLSKTGSLAEYTKLNNLINELYEKKGQNESLLNKLNELSKSIELLEVDINEINNYIKTLIDDFDNKLIVFNTYFSKYSKKIYDEEVILSYDEKELPFFSFKIKNIDGNLGPGKKLGLVAIFDFAYLSFINHYNIQSPQFIAHDKVELVDIKDLKSFFNLSNSLSGQYILPIIYDKVESIYEDLKKNGDVILELSEDNKFFQV